MAISYQIPTNWIRYDFQSIQEDLVAAKVAVLSLRNMPYRRAWVESLQRIELKREVAGTSRIEGADFTEKELERALEDAPGELVTRSQRQVRAALETYRWIATLPEDRTVDVMVILEIHRRIVLGADDDHCPPGLLRHEDENVTFGSPRHRGCEGGRQCAAAFTQFGEALQREYREHDKLIQALAAHYHLAAMHPFLDGNGRTARALEALMLQRSGLRDTCFIAMSNYYYDEKNSYLSALSEVRAADHGLTVFLKFALKGIRIQSQRLLTEIQHEISKELFRNLMYDLFGRLRSPRTRVIAERQIEVLKLLLQSEGWMDLGQVVKGTRHIYGSLKASSKALSRDLAYLKDLRALTIEKLPKTGTYRLKVRLEWPTEITETEFFQHVKAFPKAKTHPFLR